MNTDRFDGSGVSSMVNEFDDKIVKLASKLNPSDIAIKRTHTPIGIAK